MTPRIVLAKVSRLLAFLAPIMVIGALGAHADRYEAMERQEGNEARLSVERCRRALGGAAECMSEPEIVSLRDQLYGLADVILAGMPDSAFSADDLEERAAIREYDGGARREEAESLTVIDFVTRKPL